MPRVAFTPLINGRSGSHATDGGPPGFRVSAGERLLIRVAVTVPRQLTVTALSFGISAGTLSGAQDGTGGMHPVLVRYREPLSTGKHWFRLRWQVPGSHPGAPLYLVAAWSSRHPPGNVEQFVAQFTLK